MTITCYVESLEKDQRAMVTVHAILWMKSFMKVDWPQHRALMEAGSYALLFVLPKGSRAPCSLPLLYSPPCMIEVPPAPLPPQERAGSPGTRFCPWSWCCKSRGISWITLELPQSEGCGNRTCCHP